MLTRVIAGATVAAGGILVLAGAFLPTYGSGDYEAVGFSRAAIFLIAILIVPAVVLVLDSAFILAAALPRWLVGASLVVVGLALAGHLLISVVASSFACFDACPGGGVHFATGFWLPLAGFVVGGAGLTAIATMFGRRRRSV